METTQAVILAAGRGNRLNHVDQPKPLVKVGAKELIVQNIEQLQDFGISDIYIVIGHRGDEIQKVLTNHPSIRARLHYIEQKEDDRGAMLKSILSLDGIVEGPFFLTMADLVLERSPYNLFGAADSSSISTLVSIQHLDRSGANSRVQLKNESIVSIGEDITSYNALEVGVYYFPRNGLSLLTSYATAATSPSLSSILQQLTWDNRLQAIILNEGEWFDVNTPATHIRAEIFMRSKKELTPAQSEEKQLEKPVIFKEFHRTKVLQSNVIIQTGLIEKLSGIELIPRKYISSPHFILTDTTVDALYGEKVLSGLRAAGYIVHKFVVPTGEHSKNIELYGKLADEIFSYGMDKESIIISLGGGVINNLAGFLTSTLYRGIGLIHIPTSMMAQVDAAINFKQAINASKGKNLLGSYYPAMTIAIDPAVLETLDERNIRNGLAESIKHALVQDRTFFEYLHNHEGALTTPFFEEVIRKTIQLEIPLLNGDVDDDYNEMLPQYGHSIGHAVEHLSSYELLHGEAIAIGMCVAAEIAHILGLCKRDIVDLHYDICDTYNLPTRIPDSMTADDVCDAIRYDKHHVKGNPHMAFLVDVAEVWNDRGVYGVPVEYEVIQRAIEVNKRRRL